MDAKFTEESTLGEILKNKTDAMQVLGKHGVPCVSCPMMALELNKLRLMDIGNMYGVNIEKLLQELNSG